MGIVWIKALTLKTGHANVIKHVDPVLERARRRRARPDARSSPTTWRSTTRAEAYDVYDRREALKIVLTP